MYVTMPIAMAGLQQTMMHARDGLGYAVLSDSLVGVGRHETAGGGNCPVVVQIYGAFRQHAL